MCFTWFRVVPGKNYMLFHPNIHWTLKSSEEKNEKDTKCFDASTIGCFNGTNSISG